MRTGKYVNQLQGDARYKAFIPSELPFEIKSEGILRELTGLKRNRVFSFADYIALFE